MRTLDHWQPENSEFWATKGRQIARRNLWISVFALMLAFAIWQVWSVTVVKLPSIGFRYSANQLFWLAAIPALSGATLRIFYSFVIPFFGGQRWTAFSTATLLIPAIGIGIAVQNPQTPYSTMLILALLCGFGGANFSSSMSNISYFFPKKEKGGALGINGGLGNLGVSVVQLVIPLIITVGVFGVLGGKPQVIMQNGIETKIWLQNAGYIWVPFILLSTLLAFFGMDNIAGQNRSIKSQLVIFKRPHTWLLCWVYIGAFGSFIGFSAAFPLLTSQSFPAIDPIKLAFIGPFLGAIGRVIGGMLSDKIRPSFVTAFSYIMMIIGVIGVILFLPKNGSAGSFIGFFISFLFLFAFSGIASGSVFAQAPRVFMQSHQYKTKDPALAEQKAIQESATVVGFMGAVGAFGGFFIPKSFGSSIAATGSAELALIIFIIFYLSCLLLNYGFYTRRKAITKC
ncbi:MFS transporter [Ignatzschineria rhizosphaerae]|uniref:MFS transporter n=1 Tax=Ignatzschineria rhizosphaerae TaxID=2923279 RepID=A0ABY3X7V4_9GAMM|nr:MFS transporter [Ignatzschineria rhizosphaerae]UNM97132.1 MFS transporter [Ignatzschineria rhizosphaerae]